MAVNWTISHGNKQSSGAPLFNYAKSVPFIKGGSQIPPPLSLKNEQNYLLGNYEKYIRRMMLSVSILAEWRTLAIVSSPSGF